MPTPHVTPSPTATASTWQIGTYNSVSDAWTLVLDLNDRATWYVKSYDIAQPEKVVSRSGNPRTQGEKITNERYRNRYISLTLMLRSATTPAALDTAIHGLEAALDNTPWMLRFAEIGAAQYTYAIVKSWQHSIPQDPLQRAAKVKTGITLVMECEPFLLGDKLYLDNLVVNPGFEAPSGPAVRVFSDTFANLNAYSVQSWIAAVQADSPLGWWRFDELSGTTALDSSGHAHPGTYSGTGITLGQASFNGDAASTCAQFNGTTGDVSVPFTSSLNPSTWSVVAWVFPTDLTVTRGILSTRGANNQGFALEITTTGQVGVSIGNGTSYTGFAGATSAVPLNTWTMVTATYDGSNLRFYVGGTQTGTAMAFTGYAAQSAQALFIGADQGAGLFFKGNLEDVAVFSGALSLAQIQALNTAGATFTVASNVATLPAGGRMAFGSPAWGAYNTWQIRFQYATSLTANFALHYTNGSNALFAQVTSSTFNLIHSVTGTQHTLATTAVTPVAGTFYWLQVTQFPIASGTSSAAPYVQATLFNDSAGAIGSQVTTLGPVATFDAVTATSGASQIYCSGANLLIGGNFANVHTLSLFGPGGWLTQSAGTGNAAFSWETAQGSPGYTPPAGNLYTGGPVTSFGAARIECAPAGTVDARWYLYNGGAPAGLQGAIPVMAPGDVIGLSAAFRTSAGLGAGCFSSITINEFDSSGTLLRGSSAANFTGPSTSWMTLSGTYTTGANCAYIGLLLRVLDSTTGSVGATVWFDNVQVWDQTANGGQTTMPYCELRFPQSPAQLMVSGLVGDVPTPVSLAVGTYVSSMAVQHTMNLVLGSKATPIAAARLVGPSVVRQTLNSSSTIVPTLNSGSYGGFYIQETYTGAGGSYTTFYYALSDTPANLQGVYRLVEQFMTSQASYSAVQAQLTTVVSTGAYDPGSPTYAQRRAFIQSPIITPVTAQNNYLDIGIGPLFIPPYGQDSLMDTTKNFVAPSIWWTDPNAVNTTFYRHGWQALVPVDGSTVLANFTTGTLAAINTSWIWIYANGLDGQLIITGNWTYSLETAALANPANGVGGAGGTGSSSQSINPVGDAFLTLDPTQSSNGVSGVAQLVGYLTNDNPLGQVLPLHASIQYTPHYLDPR